MKKQLPTLGLYIHVPFCRRKCLYCDFYSVAGGENQINQYLQAVSAHLSETAPVAANHQVDTIYFGGGTPLLLGVKNLTALLALIRKHYHVAKNAEITIEVNPDSAGDVKQWKALRKAGVNRVSLGMQSADDGELQEIGRLHTVSQVFEAAEVIRKAKIKNLSIDLIYGLPHQTLERWQLNVKAALSLQPEHLSCYGLKVEDGTPLAARQDSMELPDEDMQAEMYLWTVSYLQERGYAQYEISNFAKSGYESRHNLKYWTLCDYAGFGPGAHSDFGNVRYAYVRDLEGYVRGVLEGEPMLSESERIPAIDRDTEYLMLHLRLTSGVDPREFQNRYRRKFDCFLPFLNQCAEAGYAVYENERWRLTPKGFLVSNQIIGGVLDALGADKRQQAEATASGDFHPHNL